MVFKANSRRRLAASANGSPAPLGVASVTYLSLQERIEEILDAFER